MKNLRLIIIVLVLFLSFLLVFLSYLYKPTEVSISSLNINFSNYNQEVIKTKGVIKNLNIYNNYSTFEICELSSCIFSIYFSSNKELNNKLKKSSISKDKTSIVGKCDIYNSKKEIIVYKVL